MFYVTKNLDDNVILVSHKGRQQLTGNKQIYDNILESLYNNKSVFLCENCAEINTKPRFIYDKTIRSISYKMHKMTEILVPKMVLKKSLLLILLNESSFQKCQYINHIINIFDTTEQKIILYKCPNCDNYQENETRHNIMNSIKNSFNFS